MPGTDELPRKYTDIMRGETQRVKVRYGNLSQFVKDKIAEADLTVHELMELNIIEDRITNLHLMKLSGEEIKAGDVTWPL